MLTEVLLLNMVEEMTEGQVDMLALKLDVVMVKYMNKKLQIMLVLGMAEVLIYFSKVTKVELVCRLVAV